MTRRSGLVWLLLGSVSLGACATGVAVRERVASAGSSGGPKTYLTSSDYRKGEEIVGALLTDTEYGLIVEDIERRGGELNWGWVKADGKARKPANLLFDINSFRSVRLAPVMNASLVVLPGIEDATWEAFAQGLKQLGLEVVKEGEADLSMELAVVDMKTDKTYIFVAMLDPFLELEGRLIDVARGEPLFLFRHQEHGTTVETAAADTASEVLKFLR